MPAYLNKQSAEYVKILNVSGAVHSIRSLYKLLSSYRDKDLFRTLSNIQGRAFYKKNNAPMQVCATRNFLGRAYFEELGYFGYFVKNTKKKRRAGKHFGVVYF